MLKKIKAFTITELTIALAISAIVTTIGYYSINTVGKVIRLRNENLNALEQVQEIRFLLKHDFSRYHDWTSEREGLLKSTKGTIQYQFTPKVIIRTVTDQERIFSFDSVLVQQELGEGSMVVNTMLISITQRKQKHYIQPRIDTEAAFFVNQITE